MPYVTPREAANALGVNPRTLARWSEDGLIKTIKTEAGQRRYDIAEYLKQKSGTTELARPSTVLYARVSTSSQRDDLKRQTEALTTSYPGSEVITEIGSGLNFRRRKLNTILERIISGDIQCLVVAHKDRLARFGFELIEWLCEKFDCKVVVLYQQKYSPETELVQDMLSVVHCFSSRLYGLRKYEKKLREDQEIQKQKTALTEIDGEITAELYEESPSLS
ncbi:MAG: IS607 family transposase [Microcoleus anatoxicus]|uniref:IS607 family transposase n=2 Tax=Microcoleus TaxID=44471 RepID=A0ABU8YP59_9CYAN|nr:MAG: IS607 family transposase [Oscillatoriales cyanobacterium]TAD95760.1 MAG: IS607 family transposase [Oscillatoriales cyanobacterium]TAE03652.1 MAG: IS607 family transposase [Oscillatoriales cyanobacterium]TAF04508.1 MAG: IS607 family transposase [Oscillatoriales cyanobacterium]TAF42019.1 MAG: IS607 family transposase [Oscillatoriales cyanobacterium]